MGFLLFLSRDHAFNGTVLNVKFRKYHKSSLNSTLKKYKRRALANQQNDPIIKIMM